MKNYPDLIAELGALVGDEELTPDLDQACNLLVNESVEVQIELEVTGEHIFLFSMIAELPPGRFRENILRDALKSNYIIDELPGYLSYIASENQLVLLESIHSHAITADKLLNHLADFVSRVERWREAIDNGLSSPREEVPQGSNRGNPPLFGFSR